MIVGHTVSKKAQPIHVLHTVLNKQQHYLNLVNLIQILTDFQVNIGYVSFQGHQCFPKPKAEGNIDDREN